MAAVPRYWFRAKAYGFGWGLPCTWQGWLVALVWLGAFIDGSLLLRGHGAARALFSLVMIALILGISYLKGEPPQWRWGRSGA
jgi:hypothetical protein